MIPPDAELHMKMNIVSSLFTQKELLNLELHFCQPHLGIIPFMHKWKFDYSRITEFCQKQEQVNIADLPA